ncbi:ArsR/SmtB family transcription factor [Nitrosophilus kaiyonis]|uniref:ArsR/SmtB family transcription factor n=1 Tax=Nitrosophilus kaiyonis TaxID=2930200 RepID=UPI002491BAC8|nr:metalloregulator ArsR/SmtB family transcription factor [Nitrosophilus kaiyonis]
MEALEDFLKTVGALYDETRVLILKFIDKYGPLCVCDLENSFEMNQSRLSRHLKILKDAGFLRVKRVGKWNYYYIREPLDRFRQEILKEIEILPVELPKLKKLSRKCQL